MGDVGILKEIVGLQDSADVTKEKNELKVQYEQLIDEVVILREEARKLRQYVSSRDVYFPGEQVNLVRKNDSNQDELQEAEVVEVLESFVRVRMSTTGSIDLVPKNLIRTAMQPHGEDDKEHEGVDKEDVMMPTPLDNVACVTTLTDAREQDDWLGAHIKASRTSGRCHNQMLLNPLEREAATQPSTAAREEVGIMTPQAEATTPEADTTAQPRTAAREKADANTREPGANKERSTDFGEDFSTPEALPTPLQPIANGWRSISGMQLVQAQLRPIHFGQSSAIVVMNWAILPRPKWRLTRNGWTST